MSENVKVGEGWLDEITLRPQHEEKKIGTQREKGTGGFFFVH